MIKPNLTPSKKTGKAYIMKSITKQKRSGKAKNANPQPKHVISDLKAYLILVIICFLCYGNTIRNEYSLDDNFEITDYVKQGLSGIPEILTHHYVETEEKTFDYRPITGITLAIEHQFLGTNPHFSHFVNILFYILCVLLLYRILTEAFDLGKLHPFLPLVICAFYAVHPAHSEVVCSIKNREEILSILFALAAMLFSFRFFTTPEKKIQYAALAILLMLLSYASKFVSLPLIAVILLMGIYYGSYKGRPSSYIFTFLLFVISLGLAYYNYTEYQGQRELFSLENPLVHTHDILIRLGTAFSTLFFYFKFLFWPFPFSFYYGYNMIPVVSIVSSTAFVSFLLHLILFTYGSWLLYKKQIAGLFIISYFICIFPYSNLIVNYTGIVAERALFLPSVWFIAAFFLLAFRWLNFGENKKTLTGIQKLFTTMAIVVFTIYGALTINRTSDWKDELTLLSADIGHLENSTLANYFYAWVLEQEADKITEVSKKRNYEIKAVKHYRKAIEISPDYSEPYFRLGKMYAYRFYEPETAFDYFHRSYNLDSSKTPTQFQLARSYFLKNNIDEADRLFSDLYSKLPDDTLTLFFFSQVKYFKGETSKAQEINDQLLKLAPSTWYPYVNRAYFYKLQGNMTDAMGFYEIAVEKGCRDAGILNLMENYYHETRQLDKIEAFNY